MDAGLVQASAGWILGWTLVHSLWQGALVAAGLAVVLRFVPDSMTRFRSYASWGALLLLIALATATWTLVDAEWRGHAACWGSEEFAVEHPALCAPHAVPAARELVGHDESLRIASPLAWVRRLALPVPGSVRSLSVAATSGVALLALVWACLALMAVVRLGIGLRALSGVVRRSRAFTGGELDDLLRRVGEEMRIQGPVEVRESAEISAPAVTGWRRPIILVPRGMAQALGMDRLADVLAHELAHVRGRHFAVNLGQRALDCLCLLNPFALWISGRIRLEREVRCDRIAAGAPASGRRRYVETLLRLEHLRRPSGPALVGLVGEGRLLRRVRRLVDAPSGRRRHEGRRRLVGALGAAVMTLLVVVQLSMTTVTLTSWAVMSHDISIRMAAAAPETAAVAPGTPAVGPETAAATAEPAAATAGRPATEARRP